MKSQFLENVPEAGKNRGQEEKGVIEDEMVGWHHQLSGHEFQHTLGDSEGEGRLACCSVGLQRAGHNLATENNRLPQLEKA